MSSRWLRITHRIVRDPHPDRPALVIRPGFADRPPLGPPLAGSIATAAGRGHRTSQSADARQQRAHLALEAYRLRALGWSIRRISTTLGVGKTTVGRWLFGVYPTCDLQSFQRSLPRSQAAAFDFPLIHEVPGRLVARGPRQRDRDDPQGWAAMCASQEQRRDSEDWRRLNVKGDGDHVW